MTQAYNLSQFANTLNTSGKASNSGLQNSSLTVSAGTGLSGGGSVSLGGSVTLNNAGVTSVSGGTAISVSGSTGGVTINNTGVTSVNGNNGAISIAGAQAWVNFNGYTSTSIRASFNVSSVTYSSGGTYAVNFATALVDANYVPLVSAQFGLGAAVQTYIANASSTSSSSYAPTASSCPIRNSNAASSVYDSIGMFFMAIR